MAVDHRSSMREDHDARDGVEFRIMLASTGTVYEVPFGKSILDVLRDAGLDMDSSCESGLCGTCRIGYLEGEPEHNDYILDDDEQSRELTICCSRSRSGMLVLDL